jgi:transposase
MTWWRPTRNPRTRENNGIAHDAPDDPPRRHAHSRRGHGTVATDRPPIAGVVGRESGAVRWEVIASASATAWDEVLDDACLEETTVNSDERNGSHRIGTRHGRVDRTVEHSGPKWTWAIDADGDGVREAHGHTREGPWTGLRTFLRPCRGVSQWFLTQDVAVFPWGDNRKSVTDGLMRALLGIPPRTCFPS